MTELLDFIKTYPAAVNAIGIIVSTILVVWQLNRTFKWNRKKTTQDLCDNFLSQSIFNNWVLIQAAFIAGRKKFHALQKEEQTAAVTLLSFFENVAILIRNQIVEPEIVFDHFCGVVPILYHSCEGHLKKIREERADDRVFENFEQLFWSMQANDAKKRASGAFQRAAELARSRGRNLRIHPPPTSHSSSVATQGIQQIAQSNEGCAQDPN